jgi:hypothetical protein
MLVSGSYGPYMDIVRFANDSQAMGLAARKLAREMTLRIGTVTAGSAT